MSWYLTAAGSKDQCKETLATSSSATFMPVGLQTVIGVALDAMASEDGDTYTVQTNGHTDANGGDAHFTLKRVPRSQ